MNKMETEQLPINLNTSWSFFQIWNKSLENGEERKPQPRERLWASELGNAPVDTYLKLLGTEPSNPPNTRSKRKFEAGNMLEWVVEMVLRRAGIFKDTQAWLSHQYPGMLEVTGKVDFFAGGEVNVTEANKKIDELGLPEF